MAWLFERTIEFAAWIAMFLAWASAVVMMRHFLLWCGTLQTGADWSHLCHGAKAGAMLVAFSVGLGILACVDRFIFDADE